LPLIQREGRCLLNRSGFIEPQPESLDLTEEDEFAIYKLRWFAILGIAGFAILSAVIPVMIGSFSILPLLPFATQPTLLLSVLLITGLNIGIFSSLQAREAFVSLSEIGEERFSSARQATAALVAGLFLFFCTSAIRDSRQSKQVRSSLLSESQFAAVVG
jgi:hypothetical protein